MPERVNWIAGRTSVLRQWIDKWVSNIASEDISFVDIHICLFTRRLWPQSLAAGTSLEINIAGFMYIQARCCCLPLHYLRHPLTFSFFPLSVSILSYFWKTGGTGVKLMWWKTTGISLWAHLLCRYGLPRSPQHGSRLSVAIGGILQISQQLSEVTSQVHRWPHSLPSSPLLEPAPRSASAQTLCQWCWAFFSLFGMFKILCLCYVLTERASF